MASICKDVIDESTSFIQYLPDEKNEKKDQDFIISTKFPREIKKNYSHIDYRIACYVLGKNNFFGI